MFPLFPLFPRSISDFHYLNHFRWKKMPEFPNSSCTLHGLDFRLADSYYIYIYIVDWGKFVDRVNSDKIRNEGAI